MCPACLTTLVPVSPARPRTRRDAFFPDDCDRLDFGRRPDRACDEQASYPKEGEKR
jgi:hypothetical protein